MRAWYDPIEQRWHQPRPPVQAPPSSNYESEAEKGYRMAHQNRVWGAVVATAQASQQEETQP